ncbi:hypothetical protein CORC01_11072 [Colletotrichum orchidophilum]|uniref:Ubiquitin-conjugating enzyme n=1 Tax=Colletotrichum orchidophilum TaxID=1209926 RepID=A0A1G4AWY1_9PEZI|nr:uncharacterized protein CORC01_11072 [Colletotrichum orchidophilum]OHE93669.1 hypothetical protein CORC01_11072 [Colletotrichum orchidophilum]
MSSHDKPNIYAELLTNIRQLSVAVTLPSSAGGHTKSSIAPDGLTLHIHHAGTAFSFPLPGKVLAQGDTALPTPTSPASRTLSWRLPLAADPAAPPPRGGSSGLADDPVPWTALDLRPGSAVACRRCAASVVPAGKAREWKDLPSENWAEMMDFWHCHKPATEHEHGLEGEGEDHEHLTRRGYGANSSIAAQPGVGMVDLTSFLFRETDCAGVKFSPSSSPDGTGAAASSSEVLAGESDPPPRMLHASCSSCGAHLGFFNVAISSVVLLKWQVSCQTISQPAPAPPTSSECLAATLLATLSRSGSSKSVVVPTFQSSPSLASGGADEASPTWPALHLWILNSNITYASSQQHTKRVAIKVLYKEISQNEADSMLESMTSDVQEVNLPTAAIVAAAEGLKSSTGFLPPSERVFKDWNVGLLDKWEAGGR